MLSAEYMAILLGIGIIALLFFYVQSSFAPLQADMLSSTAVRSAAERIGHALSDVQGCGDGCYALVYLRAPVNISANSTLLISWEGQRFALHPQYRFNTVNLSEVHVLKIERHLDAIEVSKVE